MKTRNACRLLAAAVALVAAQPAGAATATVPYGGYTAKDQRPVALKVAVDGKRIVLARTALDTTCTDGSSDFEPDGWKNVKLSRTGAFSATFADQKGTSFDNKPMVSSGSLKGKVDRKRGRATGTWVLEHKITQPDGSVVTCTSGSVKFSASARGRTRGGFFGGFTSDDYPIVFQVARSGRTVTSTRGAFELKCSRGGYRFVTDGWVRLVISASGKFSATISDSGEKFSDGSPYKVDSKISGRLDRAGRKITGTWRVRWEIPEADGSTDVCESGAIKFSIKR